MSQSKKDLVEVIQKLQENIGILNQTIKDRPVRVSIDVSARLPSEDWSAPFSQALSTQRSFTITVEHDDGRVFTMKASDMTVGMAG